MGDPVTPVFQAAGAPPKTPEAPPASPRPAPKANQTQPIIYFPISGATAPLKGD